MKNAFIVYKIVNNSKESFNNLIGVGLFLHCININFILLEMM